MNSADIVVAFYKSIANGDMGSVYGLLARDISWRLHGPRSIPYFGEYNGIDEVKNFFDKLFSVEEIKEFEPLEIICDGDKVAVIGRERCIAIHTRLEFSASWVHVFKIRNGLISEWMEIIDTAPLVEAYMSEV